MTLVLTITMDTMMQVTSKVLIYEFELVRAECVHCPWALLRNKVSTIFGIGPSRVNELPLGVAAEQSVHYFWDYF
jgi:hypothetical protein